MPVVVTTPTASFTQAVQMRGPMKPAGDAGYDAARMPRLRRLWGGLTDMRPRLRIFRGDDTVTISAPQVSIPLSDLLRVLDDANQWDRTWLQDFSEDEVKVSADLYEIITAYSNMRPSA